MAYTPRTVAILRELRREQGKKLYVPRHLHVVPDLPAEGDDARERDVD